MPELPSIPSELKPIFRDDAKARANGELPCPTPVPVPDMPATKLQWYDLAYMGLKRTFKTALYGGAMAVAIAGGGVMFGARFLASLQGAGLIVVSTALAMGAAKIREEKLKEQGKTSPLESILTALITAIICAIQKWQQAKKGAK